MSVAHGNRKGEVFARY